jgi:hypothetical protein
VANERVRFDIAVEVDAAIKALKNIAETSENSAEAVKRLSMFLAKMSKDTRVPLEQLRQTMVGLNNAIAQKTGSGLFSDFKGGDKGIFNAVKGYNDAAVASGRFASTQGGVVTSVNKASKAMEDADKKARGFGHGIDVIRTAMGTLLAVGIFQFISALQSAFTTFIHNLRETELAIYNLVNAEKRLSEQGIDVTPKGLEETIAAVRELVPILSQIQAEELVSRIATNVAPALKLTNEQIRQMAEATALLYVRNKALGKSFDEVEAQLTNAFLTGKVSQGINNLGVKISDQIVKDEALRLGLVKTAEEFNNLTGEVEAQVKAQAMLSVVYKNATDDVESIGDYMETTDAQIERSKTAWDDLLTVLGQAGSSEWLAKAIGFIAGILESWVEIITFLTPLLQQFFAVSIAGFMSLGYVMQHPLTGLVEFRKKFLEFKALALEDMMNGLGDAIDTPTAAVEDLGDAIDELDADELKQKIEDIISDTQNAREDLAENLQRKLEDLDEEYRRKALDAEQDLQRKIEDINRDAERDLAKLKEKQRQDDLRDEEKYQLALWELRMRFLMDLEDALHARDARQVIRLQKQYNLDKEALAKKKALDDKTREQNQRAELEDVERKRQERIADAQLEYQQKLADQRVAKQRELEDLNTWYAREQADLEEAQQRKLETLLKGWVDEKKITAENAQAVYDILRGYFGPGGMTDALYQYMMQSLAASTQNAIATAMSGFSLGGGLATPVVSTSSGSGDKGSRSGSGSTRRGRGRAEGGTLIATRPTTVLMGERGAEAATFTPLNRIGRNEGRIDLNDSPMGGNGMNGRLVVDLNLSPDLEARVIEKSMDGVGEVIERINSSK